MPPVKSLIRLRECWADMSEGTFYDVLAHMVLPCMIFGRRVDARLGSEGVCVCVGGGGGGRARVSYV